MKPPWLGDISEGMMCLSLKERTLEKILYDALHKEIDRNLLIEVGLVSLGIKSRKVELVAPPMFPLAIQDMRRIKSLLIRGQKIM